MEGSVPGLGCQTDPWGWSEGVVPTSTVQNSGSPPSVLQVPMCHSDLVYRTRSAGPLSFPSGFVPPSTGWTSPGTTGTAGEGWNFINC